MREARQILILAIEWARFVRPFDCHISNTLRAWQAKPKAATLAGTACDADGPAHCFDERLCDGQPQAGSAAWRARAIGAIEAVEYVRQVRCGDAFTRVDHRKVNHWPTVAAGRRSAEPDLPAARRMAQRVAQEILQYLGQPARVRADERQVVGHIALQCE